MSSRFPEGARARRARRVRRQRRGVAAWLELLTLLIPAATMLLLLAVAHGRELRGALRALRVRQAQAMEVRGRVGSRVSGARTMPDGPASRLGAIPASGFPTPDPRLPTRRSALRVCADPNNLPFSDAKGRGFENRIAQALARELGAGVEYTWWAQRRGFFRNTLNAGTCDVVMGIPARFDLAEPTRPYYRSGYVFVYRTGAAAVPRSLDDPLLRRLRVGVQLVGDDGADTPPVRALTRRGIVRNVVGYTLYGDYREESPPHRIVDAVARGDVDVAIAWGPMAGYYARRSRVPLTVAPLGAQRDGAGVPLAFDIALGVRRGNEALRRELDAALVRLRPEIDAILNEYGVPRLPAADAPAPTRVRADAQ